MREEDTCQILPVSASQAHLGETERERERRGPTLSSLLSLPDPSFSCAAHHTCTSRHCDGPSRWYWNVLLLICIKKTTQRNSKLLVHGVKCANSSTSRIITYYSFFLSHQKEHSHLQQFAATSLFFFFSQWELAISGDMSKVQLYANEQQQMLYGNCQVQTVIWHIRLT